MDLFNVSDVMDTFSAKALDWSNKNRFIWRKSGETRRLFKVLKSHVADKMRILDIGSGQGKVVKFLCEIERSVEIFASDLSISMLNLLCQYYHSSTNVKCFLTDAQNMCFNSNSFDIVTANQVFHHLPRPVDAVREIFRVLKSNGIAIILTVGKEYQNNIFPYENQNFLNDPLGRISLEELKSLLNELNFSVCEAWNDLFEMEFKNFDSYFNFIDSIGSLRKFYKYKIPSVNPRLTIEDRLKSQGILAGNSSFLVKGHYITVLLKKNG